MNECDANYWDDLFIVVPGSKLFGTSRGPGHRQKKLKKNSHDRRLALLIGDT